MKRPKASVRARFAARTFALLFVVAAALGGSAAPASAFSYDAQKIDAPFLSEILAAPTADYDVIVRALPGTSFDQPARAAAAVKGQGGHPKHALGIIGGASAQLKGVQVLTLTRDRDVDYVVKDAPIAASFDPKTSTSSLASAGIAVVGAPKAWSTYGATGRGIGVAVVDSGVYAHPDLAGRITAAADFTGSITVVSSSPLGDAGGHGTHVAGLVAGDGSASGGQYMGVAPNANIIDVRVVDRSGSGSTSNVLRGMQWILANRTTYNIRVANMSFGRTATTSYKADVLATAAEVLTFAGVTVVVSAGNAGTPGSITTPGNDPYVITVGALDDNGTVDRLDDSIAPFSSQGLTAFDALVKPDLVAPGRKMVSLMSPGATLENLYPDRFVTASGSLTPQYFRLSGTSMAAPVVAGAIAVLLEKQPSLTPAQIKQRLVSTVTSLAPIPAVSAGAGLLNVPAALASLDTSKAKAKGRVTDAFAKDMRKFIQGQAFPWRDVTFNGGVDSHNVTWDNVTWDNVTWDNVTWDNISWENFTWENVTWDNVTWDNVTWDSLDTLSTTTQSIAWTTAD